MSGDKELNLKEKILLPFTHIQSQPSKGFRRKLPEAFNHWLQVPKDKVDQALEIAQMMHDNTLILDDLLDETSSRRGIPAAHRIYGESWSMSTAAMGIFMVVEKSLKLHPEATEILCEDVLKGATGQTKEIYWRETMKCPTEEEYNTMLEEKTGGMFSLSVRLLQLFSENKTNYSELALKIGRYFQLRDDYCNIKQPEELEECPNSKELNEYYLDLTEGKFTLPIIHAMGSKRRETVYNILKQRPKDMERKFYFVSLLEELGSLEYTQNVLRELDREIRNDIAQLNGNPKLEALLDQLLTH